MTPDLTPENRAAIERIRYEHRQVTVSGLPVPVRFAETTEAECEAIARHFLTEGMERAAVICDERRRPPPKYNDPDNVVRVYDEAGDCAAAIRAEKVKQL